MAAQEVRALLTVRKLVQSKLYGIEMSLRGILRGFGLKVVATASQSYMARIRHLATIVCNSDPRDEAGNLRRHHCDITADIGIVGGLGKAPDCPPLMTVIGDTGAD